MCIQYVVSYFVSNSLYYIGEVRAIHMGTEFAT